MKSTNFDIKILMEKWITERTASYPVPERKGNKARSG